MSKFGHSVKHLVHELIPPALFFFVSFQLLAFTQALMLKQYGIKVSDFLVATIGALVVAKVVLLTDLLPQINRFPGRPLIYNILWKVIVYFAAACMVRYLEKFIHFYRQQGDVLAANRQMLDQVIWPHFWAIQIWLLVLLVHYCTINELVRVLGRDHVLELFFGRSRKTAPAALAATTDLTGKTK